MILDKTEDESSTSTAMLSTSTSTSTNNAGMAELDGFSMNQRQPRWIQSAPRSGSRQLLPDTPVAATGDRRLSRRRFLAGTLGGAVAFPLAARALRCEQGADRVTAEQLARICDQAVLNTEFLKTPVRVQSIQLLRNGSQYLVRTRSTDGLEVITVPNPARMKLAFPVFLNLVAPRFVNQDARDIENLQWQLYRNSNYKLQGLLFWVCVMAVEAALLELLGQAAGRPVADFFGGRVRREIPVYYASGNRGNTAQEEVAYLQQLIAESGAQAVKFRLGGRMSRNADSLPGRSETLIPLARKTLGDDLTLYADANSSYDTQEAIRIGRMLQEHDYGFYEEPCPFDDLWSTKAVADALDIPVAGGEQEFSLHRYRWTIANRGVDIVQPDLHYGGGFIRATRVARMAAAAGMTVVPHMSGGGLGYLDLVHYASFTPNAGPFMEFKGDARLPVSCASSTLRCENGVVRCPVGPGFGIEVDPDFVRTAEVVEL
jgi:L-alanine-DL-glutamate epimerase-like enolase superfamily enzyme